MDVRSRYRRDKFCGVRVEKMCNIFAIINVVIVFLFALTCIGIEALLVTRVVISLQTNFSFSQFMPTWLVIFPVYAALCVFTVVYGVFAVLLLQGIRLKNPKLVMAYLIFGFIVEIVMISATVISVAVIIVIRISHQNYAVIYVCIALASVVCVVYGYILYLVRITYFTLKSRKRNDISNGQIMLYICEDYPALDR